MEKVHPWCGQPSDRGWLKNRTEKMLKFSSGHTFLSGFMANPDIRLMWLGHLHDMGRCLSLLPDVSQLKSCNCFLNVGLTSKDS